MNKTPNRRILLLAGALAFWCLVICARLVWVQVICYGDYAGKASRQQQRSIDVSAVRGNIYDRNGNELAMTVNVDSVFAVPSEIPDVRSVAHMLGRILNTDPTELQHRMSGAHAFAWVARKIDPVAADRIRSLNLKGIYFQKESKRFYPKKELAAQVLGYVSMDDEGLGGVEREYDSRLAGKPGKLLISMDARKRWFGRVEKKPDPGENVVLTVDEKIQFIAERELDKAMADSHAEAGSIIVENPHTGELLAVANRPTFNPNQKVADPLSLRNRAVTDAYEPGSTFKLVTLAAALEEKITTPDEVVDCQMGSIILNGLKIHDHKPYGMLTVAQVLENSSDVGAIKIALRLGEQRFDRYIRNFGFGSRTGVELPGETYGLTKPVSRWSKVSIGAISMGQEVGVSPMQLVSMVSTIANDGVYTPPRIVAGITPPRSTQQLIAFHPAIGRRVISTMTAARMKQMMEGVVLRGTGKRAILDGYSLAGKTGTSQKLDENGHYSHQKHVVSFAGFAPINNPAVTVLVVLDAPVGPQDGGMVAAPVFSRVAQQVLGYLNVPHDIELQDPRRMTLRAHVKNEDVAEAAPDYIADQSPASPAPAPEPTADTNVAEEKPLAKPVATEPRPSSASVSQSQARALAVSRPSPTPALAAASTPPRGTLVLAVGGSVVVPDFRGKPLRTALEEAESAGLELEVSGSGVGRDQSPLPGSRVMPGGHVVVRFGRGGGL